MASKFDFMKSRKGIVINTTAKKMEKAVMIALMETIDYITQKFGVKLNHVSAVYLKDIIAELRERYKDVDFFMNLIHLPCALMVVFQVWFLKTIEIILFSLQK